MKLRSRNVDLNFKVHAPTQDANNEEIEKFYEHLNRAKSICNRDYAVNVIGDCNAKIGKGAEKDAPL